MVAIEVSLIVVITDGVVAVGLGVTGISDVVTNVSV